MSKEIDWGVIYGEGDIVCTCDNCGNDEWFPFEDGCFDFKDVSRQLKEYHGWLARNINGDWKDFCCDKCYREFLARRKNN